LVVDFFASLGDSGDACGGWLAGLVGEQNLVNNYFGLDGDVGLLFPFGDEVRCCTADALVHCARHIATAMRCLASGEHVGVVRKTEIHHALLDALRDGSEVMGLDVERP
jgi:hypothetical protein